MNDPNEYNNNKKNNNMNYRTNRRNNDYYNNNENRGNFRHGGQRYYDINQKRRKRTNDNDQIISSFNKRRNKNYQNHTNPMDKSISDIKKLNNDIILIGDDLISFTNDQSSINDLLIEKDIQIKLNESIDKIISTFNKIINRKNDNNESSIDYLKDIVNLIIECAGRLSFKSIIYAYLIQSIMIQKNIFSDINDININTFHTMLLDKIMYNINQDIKYLATKSVNLLNNENQLDIPNIYLRIRLLSRFIGDLCRFGMVHITTYIDFLMIIIKYNNLNEESDPNEFDSAKDYFFRIVLECLLHTGDYIEQNNDNKENFEQLLNTCKNYMTKRNNLYFNKNTYMEFLKNGIATETNDYLIRKIRLNVLKDPENEETFIQNIENKDIVSILWKNVDHFFLTNKKDMDDMNDNADINNLSSYRFMSSPWEKFLNKIDKEYKFENSYDLSKNLELIDTTMFHVGNKPDIFIKNNILDENSGPTGSETSKLDSLLTFLVQNHFNDILISFHPRTADAASQLLRATKIFSHNFKHYNEIKKITTSAKLEYLLIEKLFLEFFSLPKSNYILPYFVVICSHLMKIDGSTLSPIFGLFVELLFRMISKDSNNNKSSLNISSIDKFVVFFAHFLAQFEFTWPWKNWEYILTDNEMDKNREDDPQRIFLGSLAERMVRLSYYEQIHGLLPDTLKPILPPQPRPYVKYNSNDDSTENKEKIVLKTQYEKLVSMFKAGEKVESVFASIFDTKTDETISKKEKLEILTNSFLMAGSATFSHIRVLFNKYCTIFTDLIANEKKDEESNINGIVIIETIASFWRNSPLHIKLITDMFLQNNTININDIIQWILSYDVIQQYSWPYIWELLFYALESQSFDLNENYLSTLLLGLLNIVNDHIKDASNEYNNYKFDNWYYSLLGRIKEICRLYPNQINNVVLNDTDKIYQLSNKDVLDIFYRSNII